MDCSCMIIERSLVLCIEEKQFHDLASYGTCHSLVPEPATGINASWGINDVC